MSLAALPNPTFTGADLSARTNAALLEARAARRFATAALVLADAAMAYGGGARAVAAGDRIVAADGHRYEVAASAATNHHLTTAGGVKLYVRPGPKGLSFGAWAPDATGVTDATAKLQSFCDACVGPPGAANGSANAHLNIPGTLPSGIFRISDEIVLRSVRGWALSGAGRFSTKIIQYTANKAHFKTNGCEYSVFEGMYLDGSQAANSGAIFDLSWDNTGGVALQSNTFRNIYFAGRPDLTVARGLSLGTGGYMGSENLIENCFFIWLSEGLTTRNYNALQNVVLGGNIQACFKGIRVFQGSVSHVIGTGFQNDIRVDNQDQIAAGGWDIEIVNSANDTMHISGLRSESLRLVNGGAQNVRMDACMTNPSRILPRANSTAVALGAWRHVDGFPYKCTTAGTTAASEPAGFSTPWLPVTDGTAVWTKQDYHVVEAINGLHECYLPFGQVGGLQYSSSQRIIEGCEFTRPDWLGVNPYLAATSSPVLINNQTKPDGAIAPMWQAAGTWAPTYIALDVGQSAILFRSYYGRSRGFEAGRNDGSSDAQNGIGVTGVLHGRLVTGTDQAGNPMYLGGGPGTGAGAGGDLIFQRPVAGASGATVQSFTEALRLLSATGGLRLGGTSGATWQAGTGSPEGVVAANIGSVYSRTDGSGATALYVKQSGTGNTGWAAPAGTIYDVPLSFAATPISSEIVDRFVVPRSVTFAANFAGSFGAIGTNPGSSMVLSVQDDGVEIGTITITAGGAFTFATASGTAKTVAAGSLMTLVAPAVAVTSAANMAATLLGSTP